MKRHWRLIMAIVLCWFSLTSVVLAKFDPYVEDPKQDWGDVTNPVEVWSSATLVGHLGRLDPAGDIDAFALEFDEPVENWTFSASVPVCANYFESVNLHMALIGSGLERPADSALPFNLPEGMGAQLYSMRDKESVLYRSTDVMGIKTYVAPTFLVNIAEAGQYVMAVWTEEGDISPYILLTGTGSDVFAKRSPAEREKAFSQVFSGAWMHQDCQPPLPTVVPLTFKGNISGIAPMTTARAAHTATLLSNGKVLIAGGIVRDGVLLKTAELYDPTTGLFSAANDMMAARASHSATLLTDGRVLIVGGDYRDEMVSAELYDPATGTFTATGSLDTPRDGFRATLLRDGRVLITGMGLQGGTSAEVYDPAIGLFTAAGPMKMPRNMHTAILLSDGNVLIAGGRDRSGQVLANAEIYDPAIDTFTVTSNWMTVKRHKQAAVRLNDGRVLIMGGSDERDWDGRRRSAEIYDPATGLFKPTSAMIDPHFKFDTAIAMLPDGDVVIGGAGKRVEIYRMSAGSFAVATGDMDDERFFATATTLPDGHVLIAGGYNTNIQTTAQAWIYQ